MTGAVWPEHDLIILGASARAAAASARRAGFRPWCADLFGDTDLRACGPVMVLPAEEYPAGFMPLLVAAPDCSWIYTGGLENRPELVRRLSNLRPLWGNPPEVLDIVRCPFRWTALLREASARAPLVAEPSQKPTSGLWLQKPLASAGGVGIAFCDHPSRTRRPSYLQQYIPGLPCAAAYVGDGAQCQFLGATRQLIAQEWLHAGEFRYCGSIGPLTLSANLRQTLEHVGNVLVQASGLRGLFGVDYILLAEEPWPVEINPRYTASMEILEHALGLSTIAHHARAFDEAYQRTINQLARHTSIIGKAILFARETVTMPTDGSWKTASHDPFALPAYADIPQPGQTIVKGHPVMTVFATDETSSGCEAKLRRQARDLDRWLFER